MAVAFAFGLTLIGLTSACGGSGSVASEPVQETPDVEVLPEWVADRLKEQSLHGLLFGTADHGVGSNRLSFVVVRREDNSIVQAPTATVHFGLRTSQEAMEAEATLVPLGPHTHAAQGLLPGTERQPHDHPGATDVYVTTVRFPVAGEYWFVVEPEGDEIPGAGVVEVAERQATPAVGSKAIASDNATLADAPATAITTARPPDTELLRHSVADSLRDHAPFVVVFATPKFCQSRVCGPTVEVVQKVRKRLGTTEVRFIHIEVYTDNEPAKGFNRWLREWRLPTEPWVFVVDRKGLIRAKFEGAVSVDELEVAVRRHLL